MSTPATPLAGRCALVTGGSRGIGAQTALTLARLGANVIVNHRFPGSATPVLQAIKEEGRHAVATRADIFRPDELAAMLDRITESDHVDILVANAAAPHTPTPLLDLPANRLATKLAADIAAAHALTTRLGPAMRDRGWGRLIYIGSLHAHGPSAPGMAANGTSKAALAAYLHYVTDELTGNGVTANLIEPGYVATDRSTIVSDHIPDLAGLVNALTPGGRPLTQADIAAAVALLTTAGDMINGITLPVTGGWNNPIPLNRIITGADPQSPPIDLASGEEDSR
jgi:3-oxoacyl-[acyl-carrier protein] reductase